jgi:EAL and modified HD-GYP domain-containing signal transduction protein
MATFFQDMAGSMSSKGWPLLDAAAVVDAAAAIPEAPGAGAIPERMRYVARQPILNARGDVHGYELLFRSGPTTGFSGDGDAATRTVLDNTVIFGLDRLTGGLPVFVNCTREALVDRLVLVLPAQLTVLELLETLKPTAELLEACRELKARGYRIALDDFAWAPAWRAFIEIADYIKVDLEITTPAQRAELMGHLTGSHARLVAERVETLADLEMARREGFTLFQGYYFCRPVLMENRAVPANQLVHLEMLGALHAHPLDTKRVSNLVKRDASLTYRLLRMVNSPLYGTSKVITSIHGALVLIGDEMFRRVAMLAIASELLGARPSELLRMAFVRGRFCELAAALTGQDATEQYLLGILSLLPAMLSVTMVKIAASLPLRNEVREALLGQANGERAILGWLECYELGQWERCDALLLSAGLGGRVAEKLPRVYAEALMWAETNMSLAA